MADRLTLDIKRLGAQGDGVAATEHGDIFVPLTLPGERAIVSVEGNRGNLVELESASADRIDPCCPHFGTCGGCAAQHMGSRIYADWKRSMVVAAFAHRGLDADIADAVMIPPGRRRRATFSAMRMGGRIALGFHEEGSHALVDITRCPVVLPAIEHTLPALREIAEVLATADGQSVRLAVTATAEGLDVSIADRQAQMTATTRARIAEISRQAQIVRVMDSGSIVVQKASPKVLVGGASVTLPPGAFIQATAEAEEAITGIITAATAKAKRVADLFCGLGTFTFGLARRARVLAMDGDRAAVEALSTGARATSGIKAIETRVRDLIREPLSRTELKDFDAVVFDPPRAGAKAQAEMLAKSDVKVVCAISCNPATLARDCRIMADGGYMIERVVPIDQFVWSPHIEAVAVLRRKK